MTESKRRPVLTTSGALDADLADKFVCLGVYDCLLPCRFYQVDHKVSVLGAVSIFGEFVLRLLKAVGSANEDDVAVFFGFSFRELSYILSELRNLGYIDWEAGSISLSVEGEQLFKGGSSVPMIFDVELRTEAVGLDLVSRVIEKKRSIPSSSLRFPELEILDKQAASEGAAIVRQLFLESYAEITKAPKGRFDERPSLYSIDSVSPGDRFMNSIRIQVGSTPRNPTVPEVSLADWGDDHQVAGRSDVLQSARKFSTLLNISRDETDLEAYRLLSTAATEFLEDWKTKAGFSATRFYKHCLTRVGEVRSDRPTIPVLGSLFVRDNARRLVEQLKYVEAGESAPQNMLWLCPEVPYWGATASLMEIAKQIGQHFASPEEAPKLTGVIPKTGSWYISPVFENSIERSTTKAPRSLEIMLVPGKICSIIVHAPLDSDRGLPVPLGIISRDSKVVERASSILLDLVPGYADSREGGASN